MKKVYVWTALFLVLTSLFWSNNIHAFSEQRKFIGQEYDVATELNYLNARYYDAKRGQFVSQDPIFWNPTQEILADPQQLNSYSYARNNPINASDPNGEKAEWVVRQIPPVYSVSIPYAGALGIVPSFGAHSFVKVTPENSADLSQYGNTSHYTIGGYPNNGKAWGGQLQAKINEPFDFNVSQSQELAKYPLKVPAGMNVTQYDQKLLESGANLSGSNLGDYFFTGQPIKSNPNSGNVATQVVIGAGGTMPELQNVYYGKSLYGSHTPYFPLGSGVTLGTPSYTQQTITTVKNRIDSAVSSVTSNFSSAYNMIKSKFQK